MHFRKSGLPMLSNRSVKILLTCMLALVGAPCWARSDAAKDWQRAITAHVQAEVQAHVHVNLPPGKWGETHVAFKLDRSGKITSVELKKSSGSPDLDALALDIVDKSQPFPAAPQGVGDDQLGFLLPFALAKSPAQVQDEKLKALMHGVCRGC
jgi:periplasmic protein TonB